MADSYLQNLFAARIGGSEYGKSTAIYKFEKIKRAKRAALAAHPGAEIIDLGVGEPDEMAFPQVVAKLAEEAAKPENRGYADNGDLVLKAAAARYLDKVCGAPGMDPEKEIIHSIGSKAALTLLPRRVIPCSARTPGITGASSINCLCWSATAFCRTWSQSRRMCCASARRWC